MRGAMHMRGAHVRARARTMVVNSSMSISLSPLRSMLSKYSRAFKKPAAMLENFSSSSLNVKSFLPRLALAACRA
jgi:hypothetical protein